MHRLGLLVLLVSCSKETSAPPASSVDGWQCFAADPAEPAGAVTFVRQRVVGGRIESDSVFAAGGASRLVLEPSGDHLAGTIKGKPVTARLLVADGSHWLLSYADPAKHVSLDEDSVISDGVLTVTSIQGDQKTSARFVPASCDQVVAALAAYP